MTPGNMIGTFACFGLWIVLLIGGSALWLVIRGRPVTMMNIGNMIGGLVRWLVMDFIINIILSSVFGNNRRRF